MNAYPFNARKTINRRNFVQKCAACSACLAAIPAMGLSSCSPKEKLKLHVIYSLHDAVQPGPDWPNVGYDFRPVMERFNTTLAKRCPDFEFITSMATGPEEAEKILMEDNKAEIGGYIVFQMNCWNQVVQTIARSGKPLLYVDY